ncbi:MAG: Gfo/Idh/MocA family oxidoreductase [Gemmataceae bacterium]|nr:Gfo/Idh/MocA family oxidoreductase [Gemmataceae bacterium]
MASKQLRWGILGVAKINDRLLPAFGDSENNSLVGIASRSADRAKEAARLAGIPRSFGSYEEMLADPEIEAVYVPLPNHLHDEWTRRAADAGKHVLCEKPLTPDATLAKSLASYCRDRNVCLMDGFMWPHHPRTAMLRQMLDAGRVGDVRRVDATFTFQLSREGSNIRWQADAGGGSLLDVGCYTVFGIRWAMAAEPVRVFATASYWNGVDSSLTAILWFQEGRVATMDCGFDLPLRQSLSITGTEGAIRIPQMWLPDEESAFEVYDREGACELIACPCRSQIVCMLDDFADAVQNGRNPLPGADESARTLRVMDAIAQSAREERPVELMPE